MSKQAIQMQLDVSRRNADYANQMGRKIDVRYWNAASAEFLAALRSEEANGAVLHETMGKRLSLMASGCLPLEPI